MQISCGWPPSRSSRKFTDAPHLTFFSRFVLSSPVQESSSSDDSSSDDSSSSYSESEEKPAPKKAAAKKGAEKKAAPAKKAAPSSSSESDSESDDSSDEEEKKPAAAATNGKAAAAAKKPASSSDDSSSEDDSSSDEEIEEAKPAKGVKRGADGKTKKVATPSSSSSDDDSSNSDSDDSSSDSDSSDTEEEEKKPAAKKAKGASDIDTSICQGSKTVFVRNLPWTAEEKDIRAYLEPAGTIAEIRVALDYDGRPKGFAHVQFETLEGAAGAIALTGGELGGREVHIETTTERTPRKLFKERKIYKSHLLIFSWEEGNSEFDSFPVNFIGVVYFLSLFRIYFILFSVSAGNLHVLPHEDSLCVGCCSFFREGVCWHTAHQ